MNPSRVSSVGQRHDCKYDVVLSTVSFVGDEFPEGLHYFRRRELDASCHESPRGWQATEVAESFFSPC